MELLYAQNLEEGMILQGGKIVIDVEVGGRWVWVRHADGIDALPKFQLVRVMGNVYHTSN